MEWKQQETPVKIMIKRQSVIGFSQSSRGTSPAPPPWMCLPCSVPRSRTHWEANTNLTLMESTRCHMNLPSKKVTSTVPLQYRLAEPQISVKSSSVTSPFSLHVKSKQLRIETQDKVLQSSAFNFAFVTLSPQIHLSKKVMDITFFGRSPTKQFMFVSHSCTRSDVTQNPETSWCFV